VFAYLVPLGFRNVDILVVAYALIRCSVLCELLCIGNSLDLIYEIFINSIMVLVVFIIMPLQHLRQPTEPLDPTLRISTSSTPQ